VFAPPFAPPSPLRSGVELQVQALVLLDRSLLCRGEAGARRRSYVGGRGGETRREPTTSARCSKDALCFCKAYAFAARVPPLSCCIWPFLQMRVGVVAGDSLRQNSCLVCMLCWRGFPLPKDTVATHFCFCLALLDSALEMLLCIAMQYKTLHL
jgi:hypothetical protein